MPHELMTLPSYYILRRNGALIYEGPEMARIKELLPKPSLFRGRRKKETYSLVAIAHVEGPTARIRIFSVESLEHFSTNAPGASKGFWGAGLYGVPSSIELPLKDLELLVENLLGTSTA